MNANDGMMRRLSLDHLTAVDSTPIALVETAREMDCDAVCLFMEPMDILPHMPSFDLFHDQTYRNSFKNSLREHGVSLDLVYPFTLGASTDVARLEPALACAADIGAKMVNVLIYDRDASRRLDRFAAFCERAEGYGLAVAVEFYPASRVRSLDEALHLVAAIGRPKTVGINVDLLHLMRSGSSLDGLTSGGSQYIFYGQICDGPLHVAPEKIEVEASCDRLLPGQGAFDILRFVKMLPLGCPLSVEIPRDSDLEAGIDRVERVRRALECTRKALVGQ